MLRKAIPTLSVAIAISTLGNVSLRSLALNAPVPEDTPTKRNHYGALVAPGMLL